MATIVQKMLLEIDLDSLKKLQQVFHTAVEEKINKVTADVRNWLNQEAEAETRKSYEDIKQVTERAISFITQSCQQVEGDWNERTQKKVSAESETKARKSSKASGELTDITSLTAQVRAIEEKMNSFSKNFERLTSRIDLIESSVDKFSQLEDDVKVKSDHIDNTIQEMDTSMGRVQTHIERMRNQIQDVEDRENVTRRNIEMMSETVQTLSSELTTLGKMSDSSNVAFTACVSSNCEPVTNSAVTEYEEVRGNKKMSFSKATGIFTVPIKGLYGVCLRQWQWDDGRIQLYVKKLTQSSSSTAAANEGEWICWTQTAGHYESDFSLEMIEMEVGDTLRVASNLGTDAATLSNFSSFSVFLVNS